VTYHFRLSLVVVLVHANKTANISLSLHSSFSFLSEPQFSAQAIQALLDPNLIFQFFHTSHMNTVYFNA